jgi:hypothetical protein
VSLGYFASTVSNTRGISDSDATIISLDAAHKVAPGWSLNSALHVGEAKNINGTVVPVDNDATVLIITRIFEF